MSAICSVSPTAVTVNGTTASAFVVSLSNTSNVQVIPFVQVPGIPVVFGALVLLCLLASMPIARSGFASKRVVRVAAPVSLAVFTATWLVISGCGGGAAPPTNATLTITATSSGVTRTLPLNITVNH
jgi:hypothetical protein